MKAPEGIDRWLSFLASRGKSTTNYNGNDVMAWEEVNRRSA